MILRSQRVLTPDGIRPADVLLDDGRIAAVHEPSGSADEDFGDLLLMPGLVDVHVHINEPGRTEWEGFETATRAAVAGGTTTLIDMPLNCIPSTTTVDALERKIDAALGKMHCDVGFWGGLVPGNEPQLEPLWDAGVFGFKAFLVHSGVDEFEWADEETLRSAAPILERLGAPLLAHCELSGPLEEIASVWEDGDPTDHRTWLASRPPAAELAAIELLASLAEMAPNVRLHVVHLATELGLPVIRKARERGTKITAETCAHYLTFDGDEVPQRATEYKCAPPLRSKKTREALWEALAAGELSFVTTDHSPSPPSLKARDTGRFDQAWGGIASAQLLLSALWTGARARGYTLEDIAQWACSAPAKFVGLAGRKGVIHPGADADLVVFDPDAEWTVDGARLQHRHPLTPYHGRSLHGEVRRTYVHGKVAFDGDEYPEPAGQPLLRLSR